MGRSLRPPGYPRVSLFVSRGGAGSFAFPEVAEGGKAPAGSHFSRSHCIVRSCATCTTIQQAILEWTRAIRDLSGNLQPTVDVFPDNPDHVVRKGADGERELVRLRWGMPTPPERIKGNADRDTTNIRHPNYSYWRRWMGIENRCVVPATSFAEPSPMKDVNGKVPNVWFALDDSEPLFAFAGVWTAWSGVRKVKEGPMDVELYGFLTTRPNTVVGPVHEKAMPVILRSPDEIDTWLSAPLRRH